MQTFSPVPGAALATYAAKCIENEILMVLRAGKKRRNEVSLQEPVGTDKEGNEITLIEILGTEAGEVEDEVSPVSYTHLDVYKRQRSWRCFSSARTRPAI